MNKKKTIDLNQSEDLKGFEDFIRELPENNQGTPTKITEKGNKKSEPGYEHFTLLSNDGERMTRLKDLFNSKLPFVSRFNQGEKIIDYQKEEIEELKIKIFDQVDKRNSAFRRSLSDIFDTFFISPK